MGWLEKTKGRKKKKARRTKPAGAPMTLTMTVDEVKRNFHKTMTPGVYRIAEVLCEDSGYVVRKNTTGRHRAKGYP
jgi:hypothetical protein